MPSPEPQPRQSQVSLTTVFTVCFGVVSVVALVLFLLKTKVALTLALGSSMAAVAMDHPVEALMRRGLRRSWAIAAVMGVVTALLVGLGLLLVPPIVSQGKALVAEMPALWQKLQHSPWFVRLDARLHVQEQLRESGPAAVGAVNPLLSAIGGVSRERTERIAAKIYRSVGGYLGGLLGICAINAILTTVFLVIVRMPFFFPLGILSGTSSLIPYAGPLVIGAAITLFALVSGGVWTALAAAIYFVIYGQLEGNVLAPFIYRRTAHVNPLVTLLAILFLVEFMGILGAVVAVPVAAAAQIVIAEIVTIRREQARPPDSLARPPDSRG